MTAWPSVGLATNPDFVDRLPRVGADTLPTLAFEDLAKQFPNLTENGSRWETQSVSSGRGGTMLVCRSTGGRRIDCRTSYSWQALDFLLASAQFLPLLQSDTNCRPFGTTIVLFVFFFFFLKCQRRKIQSPRRLPCPSSRDSFFALARFLRGKQRRGRRANCGNSSLLSVLRRKMAGVRCSERLRASLWLLFHSVLARKLEYKSLCLCSMFPFDWQEARKTLHDALVTGRKTKRISHTVNWIIKIYIYVPKVALGCEWSRFRLPILSSCLCLLASRIEVAGRQNCLLYCALLVLFQIWVLKKTLININNK